MVETGEGRNAISISLSRAGAFKLSILFHGMYLQAPLSVRRPLGLNSDHAALSKAVKRYP